MKHTMETCGKNFLSEQKQNLSADHSGVLQMHLFVTYRWRNGTVVLALGLNWLMFIYFSIL